MCYKKQSCSCLRDINNTVSLEQCRVGETVGRANSFTKTIERTSESSAEPASERYPSNTHATASAGAFEQWEGSTVEKLKVLATLFLHFYPTGSSLLSDPNTQLYLETEDPVTRIQPDSVCMQINVRSLKSGTLPPNFSFSKICTYTAVDQLNPGKHPTQYLGRVRTYSHGVLYAVL